MSEPSHTTMRHAVTGLDADIPVGAVEFWRNLGWTPVAELTPAAEVPPSADDTTNRPAASKRARSTEE